MGVFVDGGTHVYHLGSLIATDVYVKCVVQTCKAISRYFWQRQLMFTKVKSVWQRLVLLTSSCTQLSNLPRLELSIRRSCLQYLCKTFLIFNPPNSWLEILSPLPPLAPLLLLLLLANPLIFSHPLERSQKLTSQFFPPYRQWSSTPCTIHSSKLFLSVYTGVHRISATSISIIFHLQHCRRFSRLGAILYWLLFYTLSSHQKMTEICS